MQTLEIWQHLRYNITVIDFFLNSFVFPQHARQFPIKLQTSGWDLPLSSASANSDGAPRPLTTGFSGTNDNRYLLPLNIEQQDLSSLEHTNAEVLSYLLQYRNRRYFVAKDSAGKRLSEVGMLQQVHKRSIRILIDAGAQILEMSNHAVAAAWLKIDSEALAAVYFDSADEARLLHRNGKEMSLLSSPYIEYLDKCLVYLDESHTRGTDLKLPANARGLLTLGMGQTKDHTVQGK